MLKEAKGLEYTLEILRAFRDHPGQHDSRGIYQYVADGGRVFNVSLSYVQKILPRMVKAGLLISSEAGYSLTRGFENITANMVLDICEMPEPNSLLHKLCSELKAAVSEASISCFYDFSQSTETAQTAEPPTDEPPTDEPLTGPCDE
jgi:DNA-binding IscR family transcriptional regulator